jgi:Phosphopantetheine attachment site
MSTTSSMSNAEIWTNLIGPARSIGRADKFFEMGGHSLLALQALRQIENQLGVRLEFRVFFQESLADIATRCRSERVAGDGRHGGGKAAEGQGWSLRENQERI